MSPTPAALAAAEEIKNRVESERVYVNSMDELSFDFSHDIAAIIDRHTAPKPYDLENPLADVCRQMRMRGGAFVQNLSSAMMAADPENLAIIKAGWPKLMERYDAMASNENRTAPEPEGGEG